MTAYIDNITIQGTPEEIQEFIELHKPKEGSESTGTANFENNNWSNDYLTK